jgi:hypothetical protein
MSRLDHPSYSKNSRRDDAASLPLGSELTTGRAPAARTAATAGAHHRPGGWGWALLGVCLVIGGSVASCHYDADGQPFVDIPEVTP